MANITRPMSGLLRIDFDDRDLARVRRQLGLLPEELKRANKRAMRKTVGWIESQVSREIAKNSKVPLKALRKRGAGFNRVRGTVSDDGGRAMVWIGYNPVKASYVGKLSQQKSGARAGKHFFERAFVAVMSSWHTGVFKRRGQARTPIEEQVVALDATPDVVRHIEPRIMPRLAELLRQEFNYEVTRGTK